MKTMISYIWVGLFLILLSYIVNLGQISENSFELELLGGFLSVFGIIVISVGLLHSALISPYLRFWDSQNSVDDQIKIELFELQRLNELKKEVSYWANGCWSMILLIAFILFSCRIVFDFFIENNNALPSNYLLEAFSFASVAFILNAFFSLVYRLNSLIKLVNSKKIKKEQPVNLAPVVSQGK